MMGETESEAEREISREGELLNPGAICGEGEFSYKRRVDKLEGNYVFHIITSFYIRKVCV